jgi:hypothetical protein
MDRFPLMKCPADLISRQRLCRQHHSAEGTVLDQIAEGFGRPEMKAISSTMKSYGR